MPTNIEEGMPLDAELTLDSFLDKQLGFGLPWMMSYAERLVLLSILQLAKPHVAIEIGTAAGGSLQAIARFAHRVYSLDVNHDRLTYVMPNVEIRTGDSKIQLPKLLKELEGRSEELGFVLIDGAHDEDGARADINNLLAFTPRVPLYVLMHDSFNPSVRNGILTANWAMNSYVHYVEVDFIHGAAITHVPQYNRQMWGGLALAVLLPQPRRHPVQVRSLMEYMYSAIFETSLHNSRSGVVREQFQRFSQRFHEKIESLKSNPTSPRR